MASLLALLVTFGLMWVLLIRPQQRRMRDHVAVVQSLRVGDEVVAAGGLYGRIRSLDDDSLQLEVAPGIELKVLRKAVSERITRHDDELDDDDNSLTELPEPTREDDA